MHHMISDMMNMIHYCRRLAPTIQGCVPFDDHFPLRFGSWMRCWQCCYWFSFIMMFVFIHRAALKLTNRIFRVF